MIAQSQKRREATARATACLGQMIWSGTVNKGLLLLWTLFPTRRTLWRMCWTFWTSLAWATDFCQTTVYTDAELEAPTLPGAGDNFHPLPAPRRAGLRYDSAGQTAAQMQLRHKRPGSLLQPPDKRGPAKRCGEQRGTGLALQRPAQVSPLFSKLPAGNITMRGGRPAVAGGVSAASAQ